MYKGEIKFFDEMKNNFGYITKIVSENGSYSNDIYFSGNDVISNSRSLSEGAKVIFNIVQENGKKKAKDVKLFHFLSVEEKQNYMFLLTKDELQNFALSLIQSKANLTDEQIKYICKITLSAPQTYYPFNSWHILRVIGSEADKLAFKSYLSKQEDSLKLDLIGDDELLVNDLTNIWCFENQSSTKKLLIILKDANAVTKINPSFYQRFLEKNTAFDVETNIVFFALLDNEQKLAYYFTSISEIDLTLLNTLIENIKKYFPITSHPKTFKLLFEVANDNKTKITYLAALRLLRLLTEEYSMIEYSEILASKILNNKIKAYEELYESTNCLKITGDRKLIINHLSKSYQQINSQLKDSLRLNLLTLGKDIYVNDIINTWEGKEFYSNTKLLSIITNDDSYLSYSSEISSLVQKILSDIPHNITSFGAVEFLKMFFEYIIKCSDESSLIVFIRTNLFSSKEVFELFIVQLTNEQYTSLLKKIYLSSENSELKSKIELLSFLTKSDYFPNDTTFLESLSFINSFFQQLVIKRIAFYYHLQKISYEKVVKLLNSLQWNDLSAMLLKSFIVSKPNSKEEALELLSITFQEHLCLINKIDELNDSFENLFTISSIVKLCNGRKSYVKKLWENETLKRYYVTKSNFSIGEKLEKFCEGRFWKKEELFDSIENMPFVADIFWCRGNICFGVNSTSDINLLPMDWTLNEISQVFSFNLDCLVKSYIAGWANRMNEIVERLKCRECNSIMRPRPFDPVTLGHYATPLFYCLNINCKNYDKNVRFTHCLNGKCGEVLDSRDLKTCSNGWLICSSCNTCCPQHTGRGYMPRIVVR
ncbi:MAG: hypothetical protein WCZ90_05640 [Melioribacteraceae bacterium]